MKRSSDAVFRRTPLPTGAVRGHYFVADHIVASTENALPAFRGAEGPHEGIVFWGGVEKGQTTYLMMAVVPRARHKWAWVQSDEAAVREAAQAFRRFGLGLLAQVHSHPGDDVRHSDGDDRMVLLPFEGMLSIVVPRYGTRGMRRLLGCGIHQFQNGRWILCVEDLDRVTLLPEAIDLR